VRPPPASVNPQPPRADQRRRLERLRAELSRLDRRAPDARGVWSLGLAGIDRVLPGGGLPRGALHELHGEPGQAAALGFAVALLGRLLAAGGHGLWIGPRDDLFGPGLAELGLPPERLLVVRARARAARLWALEEALRSQGLVAALAEIDRLTLTQSRRLQLAAEAKGVSAFLLRPPLDGARADAAASATTTRWRIAASGSQSATLRDLGPPRWRVELVRCRGGRSGAWQIEWRPGGWHEIPDPLPLAAGSGDRAPAPARPKPAAGRRRA
jgi:protein ImuA